MSKKVVLVTGGNNGIGYETCAQLAEQPNTHVLMASRSVEKGETSASSIRERAPNASIEVVQLDITSDASIEAAVKQVTDKHGRLDTLINNAGVCPMDVSRDLFTQAFATNATSPALTTRAFVPLLRKSQSARVVYVTSKLGSCTIRSDTSDRAYNEDYKVYRMSKAAVNMLAICDAWEYQKDGIRIFDYCPGFVTTDLAGMRQAKADMGVPGPEKSAKGLVAIHLGKQDENAAKYLHEAAVNSGVPLYEW